MQEHADAETIADDLSEKQRKILQAFWSDGSPVNTHHITTSTDLTNHSVGYHIKENLAPKGLVEDTGEYDEEANTPKPPKVYRLTEMGQKVHTVYRQREAKTEADISRVDELAERIEQVEKENRALRERADRLEVTLEKRTKALRQLSQKVERLQS